MEYLQHIPQVLNIGQAAWRYWNGRYSRNDLLHTVAGAIVRSTVVGAGGHLGLALSTAYPEYAATLGSVATGVAFDGAMTLTGEKFGYCKNADDGDFAMAAITALNDANAGMAVATAYHTPKMTGTSVQPMTTAVATTTEETCRTLTDICFSKLTVCRVRILIRLTLPVLILSLSGRRSNHSYGRFIH